jgi:RHS repeat-associated protein
MYNRDAGGRSLSSTHWWDTYAGSGTNGFSSEAVTDDECTYEVNTGENRGLKLSSTFYKNTAKGSASWTEDHTEGYSYDAQPAYLAGANYGDGLPNANPTWSYDAAGNRYTGSNNSPVSTFDNLNRPTELNGYTCTSDVLGNRLTSGTQNYGWYCLNRMTTYGTTNSYNYRADMMRVSKVAGSTSTSYFYDGQMGIETLDTTSGVVTTTDYGLGARGLDYISSTKAGTTTVGFPLYDCHGNMTACIFRSGTNYYSLGNQRHYDAWDVIRNGASTGDPKGRYCANLGHTQDDESGLIYMRARYYEPTGGRFLNPDSEKNGNNWMVYCSDDPVNRADKSGKVDAWALTAFILGVMEILCGMMMLFGAVPNTSSIINNLKYKLKQYGNGPVIIGDTDLTEELSQDEEALEANLKTAQSYSLVQKIIGYSLIVEGFVLDAEIATSGFDIVATVYGPSSTGQ